MIKKKKLNIKVLKKVSFKDGNFKKRWVKMGRLVVNLVLEASASVEKACMKDQSKLLHILQTHQSAAAFS